MFNFDEKTQVQALARIQSSLPLRPGQAGTFTRNGTVDLFAAFNVATGEVLHQTRRQHTGRDVLGFFKLVDPHTSTDLDIYIVSNNLSALKSQLDRD